MPNWCYNSLIITGEKEELMKLKKHVASKRSPFDFNKIVPYPENYAYMDKIYAEWEEDKRNHPEVDFCNRPTDGFNHGGYDWCCRNWGTKWWCSEVDWNYSEERKELFYSFDTAWSPPLPVIRVLIEKYPTLDFEMEFEEEGMGFRGTITGCDGEYYEYEREYTEEELNEREEQYAN